MTLGEMTQEELGVERGEVEAPARLVDEPGAVGLGHAVEGALQSHVIAGGQVRVEGGLLEGRADRVARLAPCPVFLMRPGTPSPEPKKISPAILRFKHETKRGR